MPSKYDQETKAEAIRLFRDHAGDYDSPWAAMCAISGRLGMNAETLRKWVRQAEVDEGQAFPNRPLVSRRLCNVIHRHARSDEG